MNHAEIITIGDELVSGETVDTSSNELDTKLERLGWVVTRHTTVRDEEAEIADVFREASSRAELVISSGGLGPTEDDLTFAGLAQALGVPLVEHAPTLEAIRQRFASIGREMTPNNRRQALVPSVGDVIPNAVGTAPAFHARHGACDIFLLPGVPREMRWLFDNEVRPRLTLHPSPALRRTVRVVGLGESKLEHEIRAIVKAHPSVRFGYRTLGAENHVKLLARAQDALDAAEHDLRTLLGERCFGVDDQDLVSVVTDRLFARGETLSLAESCTGGLIAEWMTDRAGSSRVFLGGVVSYANTAKTDLLGVSGTLLEEHGAVSEPVAAAMARGALARFGSTWAVSATGIAGPDGGSVEKPVGTVYIGVANAQDVEVRRLSLLGDRTLIRKNSAISALDLLRRRLA